LDLKPELHLKQTQKLIMTPQLQQAIKMLQLSNIELSQKIEEELIENTALEIEDKEDGYRNELSEDELLQKIEKTADEKPGDDFNEEYFYLEKSYAQRSFETSEDKKREFIEGTISREETLKEYLLRQVHLLKIQPGQLSIAEILVSYINTDGYLSVPLEEIAAEFTLSQEELESILKIIQSLDPPGVGARDIKECLLIQLRNRGHYPVAEEIVREYLNEVKLKKYDEISRKCRISRKKLKDTLAILSHLQPYPGRQFYSDEIRYIIPDVIIQKTEDGFEVVPNNYSIPRLRVNSYFKHMLKQNISDKRVKDFVLERVQRAKTFIHSIEQRESTLIRVSKAILEKQMDFFERGPVYLKPMILKDISMSVDLHESTVSRITSSKYVQTSFGVFRLKYFFSNSIPAEGREEFSSTSIKEIIKDIIKKEGTKKQLSDQKIAGLLSKRGIKIARRTVAKYRKALQILPANLRRSQ